jgi:uncharacterized membrane protein
MESSRAGKSSASLRERVVVVCALVGLLVCSLVTGLCCAYGSTIELLGLISVSTLAVGKFLPLWGITGESRFSPWEIGLVVWAMDTVMVFVIIYAREWLCRVGLVGRALDKLRGNASIVLATYPSMKKIAPVGVALFVLFPLAGTGAIAGAFLGMLLGLHRHVVIAAVSLGGLLGGMLMAFFASYFGGTLLAIRDLQHQPDVRNATLVVLVLAAVLACLWLVRAYLRAREIARLQKAVCLAATESSVVSRGLRDRLEARA